MFDELREIQRQMELNHGKCIGVAKWIRNNAKTHSDINMAEEKLLKVLEEYEQLEEQLKCKIQAS